jgi:molybdopterin synthase catalytic subunit
MNDKIIYGVQEDEINVSELISKMKDGKGGAISIFLGTTRDNFENKKVLKLFYEAHPTMALKKLKEIAEEIYEKFNLIKVAIIHRVGEVPITDESIVIISTSGHRSEAIEATSYAIEQVKKIVPIWKKEIYEEGGSEWKENYVHIEK